METCSKVSRQTIQTNSPDTKNFQIFLEAGHRETNMKIGLRSTNTKIHYTFSGKASNHYLDLVGSSSHVVHW